MASTRSTRSSSSRSSGGRSRSSGSGGDSSQMMVYIGALAVVVIIIVFVMKSGGDSGSTRDPGTPAATPTPAAPAPQATPAPTGTAKAGKKPDRPAPSLTQATLGKLDDLLAQAKGFYNEGVKLRLAGDNRGARDQQTKANDLLEQWTSTVEQQLLWQEEAGLGDWEQPAEYAALEFRYKAFSQLQRSVQLNGANK